MRARYGVSVVILKSDSLSATAIAMRCDKLDHVMTALDCISIANWTYASFALSQPYANGLVQECSDSIVNTLVEFL